MWLSILRGAYPGLPRWALIAITGILMRERQKESSHRHKEDMDKEHREIWPQSKECQQLLEAGRHNEYSLP